MLNHLIDEQYLQSPVSIDEKKTSVPPRPSALELHNESIWPLVSLAGDELDNFVNRHRALSAHGQQLFSDIYRDFSDRNDLFVLSDVNGRLIMLHSCPETLNVATAKVGLRCGVLLSESSCGSNAVTLALRYREPMMTSSPQHYGPLFKSWGAVAVPVLDAEHHPLTCIAILNCADDSIGEKLLLAKFIAREFRNFYKSQTTGETVTNPSLASNGSPVNDPSVPTALRPNGFKIRQPGDRRHSERPAPNPAIVTVGLTARQRQVLTLFAQGMSYKEIARKIGISSYKTVEEHLDAVREKLHVSHRRECIQKAISLGLL